MHHERLRRSNAPTLERLQRHSNATSASAAPPNNSNATPALAAVELYCSQVHLILVSAAQDPLPLGPGHLHRRQDLRAGHRRRALRAGRRQGHADRRPEQEASYHRHPQEEDQAPARSVPTYLQIWTCSFVSSVDLNRKYPTTALSFFQ
ncbi:uncharacterized protein [Zea mays]|uniref:uncharacterized protein n=1 Tax=Zea mays TaxID=4577 RepID=UPI0004DE8D5D|nr:uncharacterized protein LOC103634933 [Zea mays]|eukprot:XP_008655732.1 uncharacterized protein LOC103634933 [Zea mays]